VGLGLVPGICWRLGYFPLAVGGVWQEFCWGCEFCAFHDFDQRPAGCTRVVLAVAVLRDDFMFYASAACGIGNLS